MRVGLRVAEALDSASSSSSSTLLPVRAARWHATRRIFQSPVRVVARAQRAAPGRECSIVWLARFHCHPLACYQFARVAPFFVDGARALPASSTTQLENETPLARTTCLLLATWKKLRQRLGQSDQLTSLTGRSCSPQRTGCFQARLWRGDLPMASSGQGATDEGEIERAGVCVLGGRYATGCMKWSARRALVAARRSHRFAQHGQGLARASRSLAVHSQRTACSCSQGCPTLRVRLVRGKTHAELHHQWSCAGLFSNQIWFTCPVDHNKLAQRQHRTWLRLNLKPGGERSALPTGESNQPMTNQVADKRPDGARKSDWLSITLIASDQTGPIKLLQQDQ